MAGSWFFWSWRFRPAKRQADGRPFASVSHVYASALKIARQHAQHECNHADFNCVINRDRRSLQGFLYKVQTRVMFAWKCVRRVVVQQQGGGYRFAQGSNGGPVRILCNKGRQGVVVGHFWPEHPRDLHGSDDLVREVCRDRVNADGTARFEGFPVVQVEHHGQSRSVLVDYHSFPLEVLIDQAGRATKVIVECNVIPLRYGWACTIHGTQSCTWGYVVIDCNDFFFAFHMLYTGMSRVRGRKYLRFVGGFKEPPDARMLSYVCAGVNVNDALQLHPKVKTFYESLGDNAVTYSAAQDAVAQLQALVLDEPFAIDVSTAPTVLPAGVLATASQPAVGMLQHGGVAVGGADATRGAVASRGAQQPGGMLAAVAPADGSVLRHGADRAGGAFVVGGAQPLRSSGGVVGVNSPAAVAAGFLPQIGVGGFEAGAVFATREASHVRGGTVAVHGHAQVGSVQNLALHGNGAGAAVSQLGGGAGGDGAAVVTAGSSSIVNRHQIARAMHGTMEGCSTHGVGPGTVGHKRQQNEMDNVECMICARVWRLTEPDVVQRLTTGSNALPVVAVQPLVVFMTRHNGVVGLTGQAPDFMVGVAVKARLCTVQERFKMVSSLQYHYHGHREVPNAVRVLTAAGVDAHVAVAWYVCCAQVIEQISEVHALTIMMQCSAIYKGDDELELMDSAAAARALEVHEYRAHPAKAPDATRFVSVHSSNCIWLV